MSHRHTRGKSTHWYGMLAYLAVGLLGLAFAGLQYNEGVTIGASMALTTVMLVLIFGGVVTYPLLFKDAMYLSRSGYRWTPSWWKYVGVGLGLPIVIYFAGESLAPTVENFAVALFAYLVLTVAVNVTYLYRRHKYVGRP